MTHSSAAIELPCWLLNNELTEVLEINDQATKSGKDILDICNHESEVILRNLVQEEIYVRPGKPQFIFIANQETVIVQLVNTNKKEKQLERFEEQEQQNKNLNDELSLHSAKLNAIFDSTALFIWTMSADLVITSLNKRFKECMLNWFYREVGVGEAIFEDPREVNQPTWKSFKARVVACLEGKKQHMEFSVITDQEEEVWIEVFIDPIIHPQTKVINEVSCMAFEVTEKKHISRSIKQSLKEKETLLQEVHHRVKNNLQIISSIMSLQSSYVKEENTMNILNECQNRIKSMSFIHDSLYLNKDLDSIDFNYYIHGLCRNLIQSYSIDPTKINLNLEVDDVNLSLDQAIPCGLIVNELVSNALKYAYPDGRNGELSILVKEKEGRMALTISDDGVGIGEDIRLEDIDSLGLQLVFTLIEQLDGDVAYSSHQGTKYLITFDRLKSRKSWQEPTYSL